MNTLFIGIAALLGIFAGGLVNMLADDLPYTFRVRAPHYPDGTPRPQSAWLGLLAFVRGQRLPQHVTPPAPVEVAESEPQAEPPKPPKKLTWRHPITELVMAGIFAFVAADSGFSPRAFFLMGNVIILVLITIIDLEHRIILYAVILPACVYAILGAALLGPALYPRVQFQDYLIGGVVGGALFALMFLGGMLFSVVMASARGQKLDEVAFGFGDVMLATVSGLMLGWQALLFAVMIAVLAGGAGALLFIIVQMFVKKDYEFLTALPYGQYIVFGTLVMMLWRAPLVNFLQR